MAELTDKQVSLFRRKIWTFYKSNRRDLPFRETIDPYGITISEFMLQQTQVERVIPKYLSWIEKWPDWPCLSRATTKQLLQFWSGLGYNRRAVYLGKLALTICKEYDGTLPFDAGILQKLPGIGPYTANAILIFAFNKDIVAIDTNIRRVLIHELKLSPDISKEELAEIANRVLPRGKSRDWHNALMDYSSLALPKQIKTIPPISRQSRFEGSIRQIRGEIIRRLTITRRINLTDIERDLRRSRQDVIKAVQGLAKDGLITCRDLIVTLK